MKRDLLVTGCPRSGTTYYAAWLRSQGRDVGHEVMGADGIVSWMFAADAETPEMVNLADGSVAAPSIRRCDFEFARVAHLVRNPLDCIASMMTISPGAWHYMYQQVGYYTAGSDVENAAFMWLLWNRLVEARTSERIRIEDVPFDGTLPNNARRHGAVTWSDIAPLSFSDDLAEMAERYGYAVSEEAAA